MEGGIGEVKGKGEREGVEGGIGEMRGRREREGEAGREVGGPLL